jgi:hypothetical protein
METTVGTMDELYRQLPAIIEQAAKSALGLLALMVIALAGMAFVFFKSASEKTRIGIFVLLLAGVATFAVAALRVAGPGEDGTAAAPMQVAEPGKDGAAEAPTADVTGEWTATVTYDWVVNGKPAVFDETFRFDEHAGRLVGTASWAALPRDIAEATVAGNTLAFVTRSFMETNDERREVTRRYLGEIEDEDTIRFIMQTEGDFSAYAAVKFVARRTGP